MTDRCEPPPEWRDVEWHWLKVGVSTEVWRWSAGEGLWRADFGDYGPDEMSDRDFRYVAPARPDDAAERSRLEAENARLREKIGQVVHLMAVDESLPSVRDRMMALVQNCKRTIDLCHTALYPDDAATHPPQPGERDTE